MTKKDNTLRLRVFAGPNGSGKSTIIESVSHYEINGKEIDFGTYVNADDIAKLLLKDRFSFAKYNINKITGSLFIDTVKQSGLLNGKFTEQVFAASYKISSNHLQVTTKETFVVDRIAQIIADFLRKQLLAEHKKFSFETVFSHKSKLDVMRQARDAGYKVYLYYVSTEYPEINIERVSARILKGGHDVPEDKIRSRYYNALELLYEAAQLAYQAYFFDNSRDGERFKMFAHFKVENGKKKWDAINTKDVPQWFKYYYNKQPKKS